MGSKEEASPKHYLNNNSSQSLTTPLHRNISREREEISGVISKASSYNVKNVIVSGV